MGYGLDKRTRVPERVAMRISGHKTREVCKRYNIVSPQDLLDATSKIDGYHRRQALKLSDRSDNKFGR
jgi:hypothetical protein